MWPKKKTTRCRFYITHLAGFHHSTFCRAQLCLFSFVIWFDFLAAPDYERRQCSYSIYRKIYENILFDDVLFRTIFFSIFFFFFVLSYKTKYDVLRRFVFRWTLVDLKIAILMEMFFSCGRSMFVAIFVLDVLG